MQALPEILLGEDSVWKELASSRRTVVGSDANRRRAREEEKSRGEENEEVKSRTEEKKRELVKINWMQDQPNPA